LRQRLNLRGWFTPDGAIRQARAQRTEAPAAAAPTWPAFRDALTAWVARLEQTGEIRASSAICYRSRPQKCVFPHSWRTAARSEPWPST
jgi:hypothetical protein